MSVKPRLGQFGIARGECELGGEALKEQGPLQQATAEDLGRAFGERGVDPRPGFFGLTAVGGDAGDGLGELLAEEGVARFPRLLGTGEGFVPAALDDA
jgi:hypothetical protein